MPPEQPIRVVRIIARLNIGGPARHAAALAALDPAAYDVTLLSGIRGAMEGDMSDEVIRTGARVVFLPELGRSINPVGDLITLYRIWQVLSSEQPDIVETHTSKAGTLGRLAARLAGTPVVIHTFHGHVFHGYWHPLVSRAIVSFERWLSGMTTRIVTVSEQIRHDLIAYGVAPADKIVTISLGFDLDPFATVTPADGKPLRDELGLPADEPLIGNVGRLVGVKNQALFVRLAAAWVAAGHAGRFVIVGDGECHAALADQIDQLGLGARVHLLGWRRELPQIMAALDVLVNTSDNEGTPVAMIEAMAARTPVVATAVGGVPDMVQHGETGWLAPANDADGLLAGVQAALNASTAVLDAAQASALGWYNRARLLQDIGALYTSLVSRPRN